MPVNVARIDGAANAEVKLTITQGHFVIVHLFPGQDTHTFSIGQLDATSIHFKEINGPTQFLIEYAIQAGCTISCTITGNGAFLIDLGSANMQESTFPIHLQGPNPAGGPYEIDVATV